MKKTNIIMLWTLTFVLFTACGSNNKTTDNSVKSEVKALETNTSDEVKNGVTEESNSSDEATPLEHNNSNEVNSSVKALENNTTEIKKSLKVVTIYVHGYRKVGYKNDQTYGNLYHNTFKRELIKFTGADTFDDYNKETFKHIVSAVDFYGKEVPNYYSQKDADEVEAITKKYGGGIPRYALIVAKFAKFMLKRTGADKVNIVSVSMGSLVTRWMIEKDVEGLASDEKIAKWMTVEGVIRGNYALSNVTDDSLLNLVFENSPDTDHMKYQWIEKNLAPQRHILKSPSYKNILVGQISLTDGSKSNSLLKYILPFYGGFQPNDGFQLLKDTYFESVDKGNKQVLSHTLIHHDHVDIKHSYGVFATISSFLEERKRVRITLVDATVNDIHEEITSGNVGSEIIFESYIFSPEAKKEWDLEKAIDERVYESGALKIYNYSANGQTYALNQILFDNFVLSTESKLNIKLKGYEIDSSKLYHIKEVNRESKIESLGEGEKTVELKNGVYEVDGVDWSGHVKVEVIDF